MNTKKVMSAVTAAVLALQLTANVFTVNAAKKDEEGGHKVTICHATSSIKNPYVVITVDYDSADADGGLGDHFNKHNDPVLNKDMVQGDDWGDIIPAIDYIDNQGNHITHDGLNWAEGEAIWNNGCVLPEDDDTTDPGDEDDDTTTDDDTEEDIVEDDDTTTDDDTEEEVVDDTTDEEVVENTEANEGEVLGVDTESAKQGEVEGADQMADTGVSLAMLSQIGQAIAVAVLARNAVKKDKRQ